MAEQTTNPEGRSLRERLTKAERDRDEANRRADATRHMAIEANRALREKLLAALGREDDGRTSLEEYVDALVADRDRLAAQLAEVTPGEEEVHVLQLMDSGAYLLSYTGDCTAISACPVMAAVDRELGAGTLAGVVGRFPVWLNAIGDRLCIGDRLD